MYLAMITPGLGKKLAPPAIAHTLTQGNTGGVPKHIWNVMHDLPHSVTTPATIFYKRYLKERKLPGVFLFNPDNYYSLHFHAEQTADADNRMELGADRETLIIHYSPKDADIHSVIQLHEVLDRWLRKCGCGELKYWYPRKELADVIRLLSKDGVHQSGTTRIASTPDKGVVDTDLKLWGVSNIFINSSSVFPTSGQANPTFLLGAFASRLACHLTKKRN
jgi:choline dehydrogenase-like flavoprotein